VISVAYLDGRRLARSVIAGARFVAERAEPLNKINVFPVPDGDTGTNLASTLQKIAAGIARIRQRHVREMSRALAGRGRRRTGRSGAIGPVLLRLLGGAARRPRASRRRVRRAVVKAADSAMRPSRRSRAS
jgi:dihydroxyacetone kinase-like predicted kinase